MDNWKNDSIYSSNKSDSLRTASYYTENYSKRRRKKRILFQMIVIALVSSIIGGAVVGSFIVFIAPGIQASVKEYLQDNVLTSRLDNDSVNEDINNGNEPLESKNNLYKNIESNDSNEEAHGIVDYNGGSTVTKVAEKVSPSIVGIRSIPKKQVSDFSFFFSEQTVAPSEGSGIIIKSDGYILTNHHVIENVLDNVGQLSRGAKIEVYLPNQIEKPYNAEVVDWDRKTDLAVIKIDASELPKADFGDSDKLKPGELAVAIGNPGGLEYMGSVTSGVISGLNRTVVVEGRELKLIQTDAAINPGNSGGALCNSKGEVIGVNTIKMAAVGYEGLGFAIPINTANEIAESLINKTPIKGRAPVIGVRIDPRYTEEVAKDNDWPVGLYVYDVSLMSGAYKAGIKTGDILIKFNGTRIKSFEQLEEQKNKCKPGDTVKIEVYRNGSHIPFDVTLGEDRG